MALLGLGELAWPIPKGLLLWPGYHRDCWMRLTWGPPRCGHRCGPDHKQGVGFSRKGRAEVGRGQVCRRGGGWPAPRARQRTSARYRAPSGKRRPPSLLRPRPLASRVGCRWRPRSAIGHGPRHSSALGARPRGLVRAAGAAGRDATGPARPGSRPSLHQMTSIPPWRTRPFRGRPAPSRSSAPSRRHLPSCAG